ncbi:hypothetical protein PENTCL1PPCAC_29117, partial [Pristionchus entomophagus]
RKRQTAVQPHFLLISRLIHWTEMRLARSILLLTLVAAVEAARQKSRDSIEDDDSSEVEETDAEWERIACGVYDTCLVEYDERMTDCGHGKEKEPDDDDACFEPIEKYFHALLDKKEKRNQLLRKCYNTGHVEKNGKKKKNDDENGSESIGKRHRGSCRQKFGELEQFISGNTRKNGNGHKHPAAQPMGAESCHASAKRLKERCQKIESCCPRVKSCRSKISSHSLSEEMRELETKIKDERRMCREKEFLR